MLQYIAILMRCIVPGCYNALLLMLKAHFHYLPSNSKDISQISLQMRINSICSDHFEATHYQGDAQSSPHHFPIVG